MTHDLERELARAGRRLGGAGAEAQRRLHERAEAEGLLDVAYTTVDSPLGRLLAASTSRGLVRLAYDADGGADDVLGDIAARVSPRVLEAPARLDRFRRELEEYFAGRRTAFDAPVDWSVMRGFGRRVLEQTAQLRFGEVATYREMAGRAGSPAAVRAAGNALAANRVPIVVPCHRVLRTGGGLGGYTGGLGRKEFLLRLEGALGS